AELWSSAENHVYASLCRDQANSEQRVLKHQLAGPDNALCNRVLIDRTKTVTWVERNKRLTRKLVDRQRRSVDTERRVRGHDVANAASCHKIHETRRSVVRKAREAKATKTV